MPTYSAITAGQIDAESFIDTTLANQWSNNLLAIIEGDASAPSILLPALDDPIKPWIEIEQIIVAGETTIEFENLDTAYNRFMITIDSLEQLQDGSQLEMLVGTGATPTYQTSNYYYANHYGLTSDTDDIYTRDNAQGKSEFRLVGSGQGSANTEGYDGIIEFANPHSSVIATKFAWDGVYESSGGIPSFTRGFGSWITATPVTAIRFQMSALDLGSGGVFTLYGLRT